MDEMARSEILESIEEVGVPVYRDEERKIFRSLFEIVEDMKAKWDETDSEQPQDKEDNNG